MVLDSYYSNQIIHSGFHTLIGYNKGIELLFIRQRFFPRERLIPKVTVRKAKPKGDVRDYAMVMMGGLGRSLSDEGCKKYDKTRIRNLTLALV